MPGHAACRAAALAAACLLLVRLGGCQAPFPAPAAPAPGPAPGPLPAPPPPIASLVPRAPAQVGRAPTGPARPPDTANPHIAYVYGADGLRAALMDSRVQQIVLRSPGSTMPATLVAAGPAWQGPPVTIAAGRNVTISPEPGAPPATLDFANASTPAVVVAAGGALRFAGLVVRAAPPPTARPHPEVAAFFAAPELGSWPTISLEPGAEVRGPGGGLGWAGARRGRSGRAGAGSHAFPPPPRRLRSAPSTPRCT